MYQQHQQWTTNSSCYFLDGDAILPSRPDALLAHGGAFLPSRNYPRQAPAIVPPPVASQLRATTHLSSSSGMAAAATSSSLFRRTLSTGDLIVRDREEEPRGAASARYSAEERRERIDKYRSKRNQRNFQKKITYSCRKTLADNRPRVKGRFARNGGDYAETEADATADHHVHAPAVAATHQPVDQAESPATAAAPEWWPAVRELPAGINVVAELCADDDEMLAAYLGVSSISIADYHYSCHP